jgi:predicted anti-sigma-YlaC factor YlaD
MADWSASNRLEEIFMSHEPYRTWILDDEKLTLEREQAMEAHMKECTECQQIHQAWWDLRRQMRSLPVAAPQPGFSQRWRASLAERRLQEQYLQARKLLYSLLGITILIFFILLGLVAATTSPVDLFVSGVRSITNLVVETGRISQVFISWANFLPASIPIAAWIFLTSVMSILTLVWIVSIWQITKKGVSSL